MAERGAGLLIEEYFAGADERFLGLVLASQADKFLHAFAPRWHREATADGPRRPWARRQLVAYVADGCARVGHRGLVKRLYKSAEEVGDDELMGHFLVAFDRLSRRRQHVLSHWDYQARTQRSVTVLRRVQVFQPDPHTGVWIFHRPRKVFTNVTRLYLVRRALRYFRRLGERDPARFGRAARRALALYRDEHLTEPAQLLDAWGLLHLAYHGSPVLDRRPSGIQIARGHTLGELTPSPLHPEAWRGCFDELFDLAVSAGSAPVRSFALALLRRDHVAELRGLPIARLRGIVASPHEELRILAAEVLETATGLAELPIADWLALLSADNPTVIPVLCRLVEKNVAPSRLSLESCVELACARQAPVADLGLRWASARPIPGAVELRLILGLARAEVTRVREEGVGWALSLLRRQPPILDGGGALELRELIDSRHADVRLQALAAMSAEPSFSSETLLWTALCETPYDDVRGHLVTHLGERRFAPGTIEQVWVSSLLAVHRGGRAKPMVARQVAERIARRPDEADALLPLLGVVLRSVRVAERKLALAAIARAAFAAPSLRAAIARRLPELTLFADEAARP